MPRLGRLGSLIRRLPDHLIDAWVEGSGHRRLQQVDHHPLPSPKSELGEGQEGHLTYPQQNQRGEDSSDRPDFMFHQN